MKRPMKWLGRACTPGPIEIELTPAEVMAQLDPGWVEWSRSLQERSASDKELEHAIG